MLCYTGIWDDNDCDSYDRDDCGVERDECGGSMTGKKMGQEF